MQFMFIAISAAINLCLVDRLVSLPNIHRSNLSLAERSRPLFTRHHWTRRLSIGVSWSFLILLFQILLGIYLIYESHGIWSVIELNLLFVILWAVAYIDVKHMIVPNLYILLGLGLYLAFLLISLIQDVSLAVDELGSSLLGFGVMFIIVVLAYVLSRNKLGLGDVKLVLLLSLFIGYPDVLAFMFLGSVVTLGFALVILIFRRKRVKDRIPLAPIILIAAYLSVFLLG